MAKITINPEPPVAEIKAAIERISQLVIRARGRDQMALVRLGRSQTHLQHALADLRAATAAKSEGCGNG